ncbi:MAG: GTPase HflX, partial [Candidatus Neomarinimicrobiota bacterium]
RHARTHEAKTQVELAWLQYLLPRLSGQWTHLERQKGGIGTRGGMGETQIEIDRRIVRSRIDKLKRDLKRQTAEHKTRAKQRERVFRVALVGYTNAGKSTLMNALTDADVFVEDQLFATLDTTTRRLQIGNHQPILLSDTVGFIRKLPHHLIASFRTTLAEVTEADLIVKLLDASSPQVEDHLQTINEVLEELGIDDTSHLIVLNKVDAVGQAELARLQRRLPEALLISARQHLRLETLEDAFKQAQTRHYRAVELQVPIGSARLISEIYHQLEVKDRQDDENLVTMQVWGSDKAIRSFQHRIEALATAK